jgi:hypothetical protein
MSKTTFADLGRAMVVHHGERILGEVRARFDAPDCSSW